MEKREGGGRTTHPVPGGSRSRRKESWSGTRRETPTSRIPKSRVSQDCLTGVTGVTGVKSRLTKELKYFPS